MQLRTAKGRVLLGGHEPERSSLSADLHVALREWAEVANTVVGTDRQPETELVRRRGRQLAYRVALQRGVAVEYVDPVTGTVEPVRAPLVPRAESTPWGTGLTVTAIVALVVAMADVALHRGFAESAIAADYGLSWVPAAANVLVGCGLAPSLWLARHTPFWRWPAYGVAVGLLLAWLGLLAFGLLAPA